jgi:hypothetical protein
VDLDRLVERRHHAKWPDPLGKGRKFDGRGEVITSGPGFMWDHDRVHDLLRPCVLNFERLLVFNRFWDKGSQQCDHFVRLQIVSKAGARCGGAKLVCDGSTSIRV